MAAIGQRGKIKTEGLTRCLQSRLRIGIMTHRLLLSAVSGLCLASVACGNKSEFDGRMAKAILEANAVNLDGEQVTVSPMQLDCGVQSELWDAPAQVSQDRTTARLTSKCRELNFGDDPTIESNFHQPYAQVRGAFLLQVDEVSGIRDGETKGTKLVDAKAGIKLQHTCFSNPLPIMGVKHGNFREDTPVSFLFRQGADSWYLDKLVH
jgi:hypothetical protein